MDHMHARNCCYNNRHVHMLYNMCTLINNLKAAQFASVGKVHSSCVTDHVQPASAHIALAAFVGMCSSVLLNPMYLLWFEALYRRRRARAAGGSFADLQPAGHHRAYIIPPSLSSCTHSRDVAACSPWFVPAGSDCSDDQHNSHSSPGR